MSYKKLDALGTMDQSFHFQVTPEKRMCSLARASNCVCDAGGIGECNDTQCCQYTKNCPKLAKFCCGKGTVGRPKIYNNGYRFQYTRVGQNMEPWPPCKQDWPMIRKSPDLMPVSSRPQPNAQLESPCFNEKDYKWTDKCTIQNNPQTNDWTPPVF
jgi:hypothetical protein